MGERGGSRYGRSLVVVVGAAIVAAAAGGLPAQAASNADGRTIVVRTPPGDIGFVAMDGFEVAIVDWPRACQRVEFVALSGGPPTRGPRRSVVSLCHAKYFVSSLALAGSRAYWVANTGVMSLYQSLLTVAPGSAVRTLIPEAPGSDNDLGPFLGPLAASGSTFAYSQWRAVWLPPGCDPVAPQCTRSAPLDTTLTLRGRRVALPSPGGIVASVDSGRAAVLLSEGRVAIVTRHAPPVIAAVPGANGPADGAAIAGRRLVVLAHQRLWAFDAATGRLHASWPAAGGTSVDLWNGTAVYTTKRQIVNGTPVYTTKEQIVAVRLANGHRRLIQRLGHGREFIRGAQIEAGGIVWASTTTLPAWQHGYHGPDVVVRVPLPALR
jgi:hypothetical protein